jgi:tetratricopeptide (TPR) repeat protein
MNSSLDIEFFKASFDMSLVELNIASIKAKQNDFVDAISCYEKAVDYITNFLRNDKDTQRFANQKRHLIFALGRIGSLKMKLKDNVGALEAYQSLIRAVDSSSPESSVKEKAKAHVKCATIYRQMGTKGDNASSIVQLKEALQMYTAIYGASHKDTVAISTSLQQWKTQDLVHAT